jgi:hypothetical protein
LFPLNSIPSSTVACKSAFAESGRFGYITHMNTVEMAVEKVRQLDDARAGQLLAWLDSQLTAEKPSAKPLAAMAMLGFARRFHPQPRTTDDWMAELRAGERA